MSLKLSKNILDYQSKLLPNPGYLVYRYCSLILLRKSIVFTLLLINSVMLPANILNMKNIFDHIKF